MTPADEHYTPSASDFEAMDEADQWRAQCEVEAWLTELYPFAVSWRRDELIDAGVDALQSIEDLGLEWPSAEGPMADQILTSDALSVLKSAFALQWREQCDWRLDAARDARTAHACVVRATTARTRARPRAYRARRRHAPARSRGPDDDSGESEPPLAAVGDQPRFTRGATALRRALFEERVRACIPVAGGRRS